VIRLQLTDSCTGSAGPCVGNIAPIERLGFDGKLNHICCFSFRLHLLINRTGLCLQDGPLAIRQATYASVFPAGLTAAASWDKGLIYTRGLYMAQEFRGKGANIALGPVVGVSPACFDVRLGQILTTGTASRPQWPRWTQLGR
jgi:beta-glucosidase